MREVEIPDEWTNPGVSLVAFLVMSDHDNADTLASWIDKANTGQVVDYELRVGVRSDATFSLWHEDGEVHLIEDDL